VIFPIEWLVVHHTAGPDTPALEADNIRDYHVRVRRWRDAGYHVLIERVEGAEVPLILRPWDEPGAHCLPMNRRSLGVALAGNFDETPPDAATWATALRTLTWIRRRLELPVDRVIGHREGDPGHTVCPGRHFDMAALRAALGEAGDG